MCRGNSGHLSPAVRTEEGVRLLDLRKEPALAKRRALCERRGAYLDRLACFIVLARVGLPLAAELTLRNPF